LSWQKLRKFDLGIEKRMGSGMWGGFCVGIWSREGQAKRKRKYVKSIWALWGQGASRGGMLAQSGGGEFHRGRKKERRVFT